MAPATSPASSPKLVSLLRRKKESPDSSPDSRRVKKYKSMADIMKRAQHVVLEPDDYSDLLCEQCGSGELPEELLLCDKCDKGFHMKCVRPIVVRVPIGSWFCTKCSGEKEKRIMSFSQKKIVDFFGIQRDSANVVNKRSIRDAKKRRRRPLVYQKKRRRLLPFVPSEDPAQRLKQMASLASALTALHMEFSDDLTYMPKMAPRAANQATLEDGGMQNMTKEDMETLELCRAMSRRGECPPFMVVYDSREGYTVEADGPIKDLTFIAEYTGDVDYIKNREFDDGDSMMTLLRGEVTGSGLVICADKRGNIARFINGINNHTQEGRKKQNCKCVRYCIDGESRVLLVATRDISKGERLYYNYNGYEHEYPTHHFV